MPLSAEIIILNYNGEELLPRCLPSIVTASEKSRFAVSVTVLDNGSKDRGLDWVRKEYPQVKVVLAPKNLFLCSYNDYARNTGAPVMIFLNNDIRVAPDFIDPLLEPFEKNEKMFMVAPRVMDFEGKEVQAGAAKAGVKWGMFWCDARYPGYEKDVLTPSDTFSSGFGAFSREKFIQLGGYDIRYLPGIMEDVDLCYRARQNGFTLFYEPRSVVYHLGQASFKKAFGNFHLRRLAHRNNFLFMWKTFRETRFFTMHLFFLPARILYSFMKLDFSFFCGFCDAFQLMMKGK